MKRLYLLALVLSVGTVSVHAQGLSTPSAVIPVVSAPAGTCPSAAIWEAPISSPGTLYYCSGSPGTWTLFEGSGGGIALPAGAVISAAIPQATAPTVTPHCTGTCATSYQYSINFWYGSSPQGFYSAPSVDTTVSNAATLDGTHYNTISTTCPAGATFWTASRDVGGVTQGAVGGANLCNASLVDNGLVSSNTGPNTSIGFSYPGLFVNTLMVGDLGDVQQGDMAVGTSDLVCTPDGGGGGSSDGAVVGFQYCGTTVNRNYTMGLEFTATDHSAGTDNIQTLSLYTATTDGNLPGMAGIFSQVLNLDSVNTMTTGLAVAFQGEVDGLISNAMVFLANPSGGTSGTYTNYYDFYAAQFGGVATNGYGYYSNIAAGAGQWAEYHAGTAASYFGGPVIEYPFVSGTPTITKGTNTTSAACASGYTCSNVRGELTIVGGTATTGTIATISFSTTLGAAPGLCIVTQNGGATNFGIGHGTPGTSSFTITSAVSVASSTLTVDYFCQP